MLSECAIRYFDAFCRADIVAVNDCLSDNIGLRDWSVDVSGIDAVLNEFSIIFKSLTNVDVCVVAMYEVGLTVIAELIVSAEETGSIKVVDILSFDEEGKIRSIRAYKG